MANRRLRKSARRHDNSGLIWTATQADFVTFPQGTAGSLFTCVIMTQDVNLGAGEAHATFLRARGGFGLSVVPDAPAMSPVHFQFPVYFVATVCRDDQPTVDAGALATYVDQDVLWTWQVMVSGVITVTETAPSVDPYCHVDIDIKSKRKLETGQNIQVWCANDSNQQGTNTQSVALSGVVRSLLKLR